MFKTLSAFFLAVFLFSGARAAQTRQVVFADVSVVSMENDQVLSHRDVVVEGGIIRGVGQHDAKKHWGKDATVVNGAGKFLLPGLADMHIHTDFGDEEQLKLYVANGVTTVLNLNGNPTALEWKRKIAAGQMLGPTFYTSGQIVDGDPPTNNTHLVVKSREEAEKAVDEQAAAGYDFVKPYSALSREEYEGVVAAARRDHIRLVGHASWNVGVQATIDAHQDAIAHVEELYRYFVDRHKKPPPDTKPDPAKIEALATALRDNHVWVITTLSANTDILKQATALDGVLHLPEMRFVPKSYLDDCKNGGDSYANRGSDWVLQNQIMVPFLFKIVAGLKASGVPMMAGTDATNPIQVPGISLHDELEELVKAGLTPYEALATATGNPQIFLGRIKDAGTVTVGKTADVFLVDGDPTVDIANTRKISGVMVRGRFFAKRDLERMKDEVVERFGKE
jgi:hypothetical protein